MSAMRKAVYFIAPAVISGAGLVAVGYFTYKYLESKNQIPSFIIEETDTRSSESFCTAPDYESGSDYFDIEEEGLEESDQLFEGVDKLMQGDESKIEAAYLEMQDSLEFMSKNPNFLWRYAKVHHLRAKVSKNKAKELTEEGLKYAKKAVEYDPENSEAHKWFAILTGRKAEFVNGVTERANNGKIFFYHIQKALRLRPKDWELHHLLGMFEYELASLSMFEKPFARRIFKNISNCEYSVALDHFKTAEKYNPNSSKQTKLFLAKCLCGEKKYKEAKKCLEEALEMEVKSFDDKACHEEVLRLLEKGV